MASQRGLLVTYIRNNWYIYASGISFSIVANLFQAYFPKVLGNFTDQLQQGGLTKTAIWDSSMILLLIGIAYGVLGGIGQFHIMYVGRKFEWYTRRRLFGHFTTLGEQYYSKNGVGKLLSYVMNDVTTVRESIAMGVNQTANAVMLIISVIVMMILSDIPIYLILVCISPLILIPWVVVRIGPNIRKRSLAVQESLGAMTESAEEQFGGIRVTKKFAVEDIMNERFGKSVDRIMDNQLKLVRISSYFQALIPFLGALSLIITLAYGGYLALDGTITLGNFVALTLYVRMMVNPLQAIGNVINTIQRSRASVERLNDLLNKQPEIKEEPSAVEVDWQRETLSINDLSFAYPDSPEEALKHISLQVTPGKTIGIVGKTGSGKTTLTKLLLRVYDPPLGTVTIGDKDLRSVKLENLRGGIAYVPQDGFLFSSTIRDNISFYKRSAELAQVEKAARHAKIHESIMSFPDGFETKLGERGVTLSGGQRQRTALARGMMMDAPILILDDSVSAVDAVTETAIIDTIRKKRQNKTTIIIAHRISALKHADEIIVLDEGRIVQRGTHGSLLAQGGIYAMLHAIQEEGSGVG
ncbi:ABC transporter ATP-binding protein [Paenibacillus lignilyticus]|uniref:ABC transporter ATP-binding protein n=1 Tax=Paenibacillus lignilyticus TaxID=1172615 RepID=A0ABS5CFQ9_9BACL|nr:ABC transporter ATP-binding protein [Paenibacillus lignilyticus]MBP3964693.1 ABC transporter ATP-binding protein [Paenibacillus lignilyticus]